MSTAALPVRFRRNTISNYAKTVVSMVLALVTTPVLVHGLGRQRYGVWALAGAAVVYLELLELGFGETTVKYVAELEAKGDRDAVRGAIATSVWLLAVPGLLVLAVGALLAVVFPLFFHLSPSLVTSMRVLLALLALDLAVSIPGDTFGGTLVALQRYDLLNVTLVAVLTAQAIAWVVVLAADGGLVALGVATVAMSLAGQVARYVLVRRLVDGVTLSRRAFDRALVRPFAGLSLWYAIRDLAEFVIGRIDVIVVGLVVNVAGAAVYAVGEKLALVSARVVATANTTFFPHASELAARDDDDGLRAALVTGTRFSLAITGPLLMAIGVLARPALIAWVGGSFGHADMVVVYLTIAMALEVPVHTGVLMLRGTGRAKVPALVAAAEAVVNLSCSVAFGRALGIRGVALGTLVATGLGEVGFFLPYVCRQFGIPLRTFVGRAVLRGHLPAALASGAIGWGLRAIGVNGLVPVLAAGAAIVVVYLGVFALTGLDAEERRRVLGGLRRGAPEPVTSPPS